ncbi:glycoside hydrolase family 2 protein [Desulfurobacterium crinifex]
MNIKNFFVFLCVALTLSFYSAKADSSYYPRVYSLNGVWHFKVVYRGLEEILSNEEKEVKVPSNWFFYGNLNHSGVAWFEKNFDFTPSSKSHYLLCFKGVDYKTEVFLNNKYVGKHTGYFQKFCFNVTNYLSTGKNTLGVKVDSPFEPLGENWSLRKTLIKGILNHHDMRPGGAWSPRGQDYNTGGIWNDVYIEEIGNYYVDNLLISPVKVGKEAVINVSLDIISYSEFSEKTLNYRIVPHNFTSDFILEGKKKVTLKPGRNHVSFSIRIKNPKLWSTWDYGFPYLYKLILTLNEKDNLSYRKEETFGIRSFFVDDKGQWYLNGKRIFVRGTNYISSQWMSEMTDNKYIFDLELMKKANINAIRVHAHIEPQRFYKLADEYGMLIVQDFPLQWGYIDSLEFEKEAIKQAKDMVFQFYNHPSIVVWQLHNEPPWDAWWMKYKYRDYNPKQNIHLDNQLFQEVRSLDKTRYVKKASLDKEHFWAGWYFGDYKNEFQKKMESPLISEFGAQSLPNIYSLLKIIPAENIFPKNDKDWEVWEYHNFQRYETFNLAHISQGKDIKEFIENSQKYQYKLLKYAIEHLRLQRYNPVSAIFQFVFRECWPSINWGIVDFQQLPKLGYYAVKMAYQPLLVVIDKGELVIINDSHRNFKNLSLTVRIGDKVHTYKIPEVKEDSLLRTSIKINPEGRRVIINLKQGNKLISYNIYEKDDL